MSDDKRVRPGFFQAESEEFSFVRLIVTWSVVAVFLTLAIAWLFTPAT